MENEKKYTREEINAIVNEELRRAGLKAVRELNADEMDHVAGGVVIPSTHEEIDMKWDLVESVVKKHGPGTAAIFAKSMGLIKSESHLTDFSVSELREYMHRTINGEKLTLCM